MGNGERANMVAALALGACIGCESSAPPPPLSDVGLPRSAVGDAPLADAAPTATDSPAPAASAAPAALRAPGPFAEIPVDGFAAAVVSLPLGATSPRPVVLATHGNYDRPEWQCEVWRGIVGDRAFILCPRGIARPDSPSADDTRFTYVNNQALEKEIEAGLTALRARFGTWMDSGPMLYTGFSLGAIMGVAIASRRTGPERYPRMILVEGGFDRWTAASIKAYVAGGPGRRILFACGQPGCVQSAKRTAATLEKAGVATRIVHGKGVGHSYDGPVAAEVKGALDWVLEGDTRF